MSSSLRIPLLRPTEQIVTFHPKKSVLDDSVISKTEHATSTDDASTTTTTNIEALSLPPSHLRCCDVCYIHNSQYTCPRCHIPYCSLICYQNHVSVSSTSKSNCIEQFSEQRVSQILQLEVKEQASSFQRKIINYINNSNDIQESSIRTNDPQETSTTLIQNTTESPNDNTTKQQLSREELQQIWSLLERIEVVKESDTSMDEITILQQTLQQHCSIHVQKVVQQAIQQLTNSITTNNQYDDTTAVQQKEIQSITEWMLEPWSPWWCRDLIPFKQSQHISDDDEDDDDPIEEMDRSNTFHDTTSTTKEIDHDEPTLDERLLSVPKFDTFYRRRSSVHDVDDTDTQQRLPQFPLLQYNLIDILFATVYTLRTYHGVSNIIGNNDDMVIDAANTLSCSSLVLQQDQRYTTLESVLLVCTNIHHPLQQQLQYDNHHYRRTDMKYSDTAFSLIQDVALLYENHRYVARALMEASDILQMAIKEMKRSSKGSTTTTTRATDTKDLRKSLRRVNQKIQFYWSWTMAVAAVKTSIVQRGWPYRYISNDIRVWIEGWQLPNPKMKGPSIQITV